MITTALVALAASTNQTIAITPIKTISAFRVLALAPAPTGTRVLASCEDNTVRIVDCATKQTVRALAGHPQPCYGLAWNPLGTRIATGDESARIWIWNSKTGEKVLEIPRAGGHTKGIQALSFSKDGRLLASTGNDDVVIIWDVQTGKKKATIKGNGINLYGALFGGPDILGVATLGKGVQLYSAKNFTLKKTLGGHGSVGCTSIAYDGAGARILSTGKDMKAVLWDAKSGARAATFSGHEDYIMRAAFSPTGRLAATSASDRKVIVWDTKTKKAATTMENMSGMGSPLAFTRDGSYFCTVNINDALVINSVYPNQSLSEQKADAAAAKKKKKR
ncbi:MAG: hypothetical protein HONBIEJF_01826 [Fimbriimonadaceae bacterium]|nr:hypothetical protein [Fimbriimonadaceae bacterium]